ncbi:hybrid sensor histidine kinase/response regulator [Methanosphaerula subterraneus]|uniref:hybrid sensor histidine kinase/response regulator n=1 Tax=Methanosphaerula subterraneus TaxID=3350244 RepID=UPI003F83DF92
MDSNEIEFLKRLLVTYRTEAQEHLTTLSSQLVELEASRDDPAKAREILELVFREAHSLKGASRAVNLVQVEKVCQAIESVFSALKQQAASPSKELFDLFSEALDVVRTMVATADPQTARPESPQTKRLIARLEHQARSVAATQAGQAANVAAGPEPLESTGGITPQVPPEEQGPARRAMDEAAPETTVRISVDKLERILHQVEEFILLKLALNDQFSELQKIQAQAESWDDEWMRVSPDLATLRQVTGAAPSERLEPVRLLIERQLTFLDWNQQFMRSLEGSLNGSIRSLDRDRRSLETLVDTLLDDMRDVLMLPASSLFDTFPRSVRDLAQALGKEVRLEIRGGGIAIDRRILDEMHDPLLHLLRNAIDHGIEPPATRKERKKTRYGLITIEIELRGGSRVEITIADDGAGIDLAQVKRTAVKGGLLPEREVERMNDQEVTNLLFRSGMSTSPIITDLSGHGLGLAIVLEKVEKLGGSVTVESTPGAGTSFHLLLPLTLVKFKGVLVTLDDRSFVFPMAYVERTLQVPAESITTVQNHETLLYEGEFIPVVRLGSVLELPERPLMEAQKKVSIVVARASKTRIGFSVDEVRNEQDVLVKSLGKQLSRVRNISGTTVIGNGTLVPILHVPDLVKSVLKPGARHGREVVVAGREPSSILVAEDSITSRTLLKNILESAGYRVTTAVDGQDAWNALTAGAFDLVVSDVDMPRMSGFDLTRKIRSDQRYADLPVVLVTSLDSAEDRERGIEVGASAYIVKSSFDQSNLIEIIDRLAGP